MPTQYVQKHDPPSLWDYCTYCGVPAGERCRNMNVAGAPPTKYPHPQRHRLVSPPTATTTGESAMSQSIVLSGNPGDGFTAYGPFDPADAQRVYDEFDGDWWVLPLEPIEGAEPSFPNPSFGFQGVRARIVYEWINHEGKWTEGSTNIPRITTEAYLTSIRQAWEHWQNTNGLRADRRNIKLEIRPIEPDWVSVSYLNLEGSLLDAEASTYRWGSTTS